MLILLLKNITQGKQFDPEWVFKTIENVFPFNSSESDESDSDLDPAELPNGENGANGGAVNDAARNLRLVIFRYSRNR